jgi:hypothetical protein
MADDGKHLLLGKEKEVTSCEPFVPVYGKDRSEGRTSLLWRKERDEGDEEERDSRIGTSRTRIDI